MDKQTTTRMVDSMKFIKKYETEIVLLIFGFIAYKYAINLGSYLAGGM